MLTKEQYEHYKGSVEESSTYKLSGKRMVIASILSDVQEEIERGLIERANDNINIAKYLLFELPEDVLDSDGRFLRHAE